MADTTVNALTSKATPVDADELYITDSVGVVSKKATRGTIRASASETKTRYEANADTNAFTDAEKTNLGTQSGTNTGDQTSIVGISGSLAEFNTALSGATFSTGGGTATGTNTGDQTSIVGISGTVAQFNTALSDGSFTTGGGTATGTNTGDQTSIVGISGSLAEFNTALSGASFSTGGGTATGTNTGDQTSIVGITGTVAQFNTAITDGNLIGSVEDDTTPTLGGDLNTNGKTLTETLTATAANTFAVGEVGIVVAAGTVTKAKADAEGTTEGEMVMATEAITGGNPGLFAHPSLVDGLSGLTAGSTYYLSAATAGAITTTAPSGSSQFVRVVGYTRGATTTIKFSPSDTWIKLVA